MSKLRRVAVGVAALASVALVGAPAATSVASAKSKSGATTTPIRHVVVIFQENVSFDHYFGTYPKATNTSGVPFRARPSTPTVDGLANTPGLGGTGSLLDNNPNLDTTAHQIDPRRLDPANINDVLTCDQDHNYNDEQKAFDGGAMDKFVTTVGTASGTSGTGQACVAGDVMNYYDGAVDKAKRRTNLRALERLTQVRDGRRVIVDDPPVVEHVADISMTSVLSFLEGYAESLSDDRRRLLAEFELVDVARKVVGVGSVGTRCYVVVGQGRAGLDPLILQVKEANDSVLAPFIGRSEYDHEGRRVVEGQRLMQAASDMFLGWSAGRGHQFYVRQLHDMKGGIEIEGSTPDEFERYANLCAATLARAHARSLDPAVIAGYCGKGRKLGTAISRFAEVYADLTEHDHATFLDAIATGEIAATTVARKD
jgi:hypothetical protein